MTIPSGTYVITSKVNDLHVGRPLTEDRSLFPKRIVVLPQDSNNTSEIFWVVEKTEEVYILKARGSPVAPHEGKLFADLVGELEHKTWFIVSQPQHGENVYTVENTSDRKGWVVPHRAEELSQVEVKPLTATDSLPPQYPATELFVFNLILDD
ncbi:hypothetical protein CC1G_03155 [Coprinopsis cinerea okayama7|uniref:Serine protease inhibitor n=1 Tax=Coprinopsis cinerea (strain Okayama-7 / 130 / ATCC MYA-4618 / FGSC 9003) TaxID=240176 RepID=A8PF49_COPC7|nr:hypothetical protein CC1G_03155 [Coprinopsis cinerea okayama7\|eukprot:XP_001840926.1 hypothetical protein CC1G_03155 [Coprinopsis cinerea okayama7\